MLPLLPLVLFLCFAFSWCWIIWSQLLVACCCFCHMLHFCCHFVTGVFVAASFCFLLLPVDCCCFLVSTSWLLIPLSQHAAFLIAKLKNHAIWHHHCTGWLLCCTVKKPIHLPVNSKKWIFPQDWQCRHWHCTLPHQEKSGHSEKSLPKEKWSFCSSIPDAQAMPQRLIVVLHKNTCSSN